MAFGYEGGFATILELKTRFRSLRVSKVKNEEMNSSTSHKVRDDPCLWTKEIADVHAFVVAGGGGALHTLFIGHGIYNKGRDEEAIVDDFVTKCPKVNSISIGIGGDPVWTDKFMGQLESLQVFIDNGGDSKETVGTSNLFDRLGTNLKRLNVVGICRQRDEDPETIRLRCPNLVCVTLPILTSPALFRLLLSYKGQLKYGSLETIGDLEDDHIENLTVECPGALFHVSGDYEFDLTLTHFGLIGPQLESVDLDFTEPVDISNAPEWATVWDGCVHLRHLEYHPGDVEASEAIFSTTKNELRSLHINFKDSYEREKVERVLANCAKGTRYCVDYRSSREVNCLLNVLRYLCLP